MLRIIDFGGHPFTVELASTLAAMGERVQYGYCSSNDTAPHGDLDRLSSEAVDVVDLQIGRHFRKHHPLSRLRDEIEFGWRTIRATRGGGTIVACQLPVVSALMVRSAAFFRRQRFALWLQDFQADIAAITNAGAAVRCLATAEAVLIRRSSTVVAISDDFADRCRQLGRKGPITVLANWAPIERIPDLPRVNDWSRDKGVRDDTFRVMYAGTMGSKHRGEELQTLFERLLADARVEVVCVSGGAGAIRLRAEAELIGHPRMHLLGFQPHESFASVLATADVLLVTLDAKANEACVPSKVLSYLCAGRPIVGLLDPSNPSAQLVKDTGAGTIAADVDELEDVIRSLMLDDEECRTMGKKGREYAEATFQPTRVASRFLRAVRQ